MNNELHNLLGVDACLLSLAKSTVLEIEGLPEKGSLIRYPFSFVDKRAAQGGEHSAIFFITWTKLLNDDLKPAIVKLGMQVARMIKASLTQSMKIDGMQSSVSDNQLDYITRFISELNHGTVNIWEVPGYRIEMSPFGGIKDSGLGYKEGVMEAMKSFTNVKSYSLPWL